jgi:hypothetical protein
MSSEDTIQKKSSTIDVQSSTTFIINKSKGFDVSSLNSDQLMMIGQALYHKFQHDSDFSSVTPKLGGYVTGTKNVPTKQLRASVAAVIAKIWDIKEDKYHKGNSTEKVVTKPAKPPCKVSSGTFPFDRKSKVSELTMRTLQNLQ